MYPKDFDNTPTTHAEVEAAQMAKENKTTQKDGSEPISLSGKSVAQKATGTSSTKPKTFDSAPTSFLATEIAKKLKGLSLDGEQGIEEQDVDIEGQAKKTNKGKERATDEEHDRFQDIQSDEGSDIEDTRASEDIYLASIIRRFPGPSLVSTGKSIPTIQVHRPLPEVPVVPHFELRPVPGAVYIIDYIHSGLFATANIVEGTRLICEAPLITFDGSGDQIEQVWDAYNKLSDVDQARVMALRPHEHIHPRLVDLRQQIDTAMHNLKIMREQGVSERLGLGEKVRVSIESKLRENIAKHEVVKRFCTHSHQLAPVIEEQYPKLSANKIIQGLFAHIACIRHSCVPNCFVNWNSSTGRMTIHATKKISKDEELTISFMGKDAYYQNLEGRETRLRAVAALPCWCPACDDRHPSFTTHAVIRAQLHTVEYFYTRALSEIDSRPEEVEQRVINIIRLLGLAGCTDAEIVKWRVKLRDELLPRRGQWIAALAQARLALRMAINCYGADFLQEVEPLQAAVEKIQKTIHVKGAA
ncbi:hypothetical protein K504DRAFT_5690 [Pleomassaria siparia CBS 279.74]|uniref:SET domain-containing protein n=1 Tax=Pleomassaria siparia CBS 279.74 TaxID=1314801 RepID=A0A6G1KPH5_9PLEO|nr:hypothetical protein K504DRAFT_5690 [Pleomassaria siparia CBS 279.74]